MGIQISIAQAQADESAMALFLQKRGDFVCASRFHTTTAGRYFEIGACNAVEQVILRRIVAEALLANLSPVVGKSGLYQINPYSGGLLEWVRTTIHENSGVIAGRLYYATGTAPTANVESVPESLARQAFQWVRRSSPIHSLGRRPTWIGTDLAKKIAVGDATLVYPTGKPVPLAVEAGVRPPN